MIVRVSGRLNVPFDSIGGGLMGVRLSNLRSAGHEWREREESRVVR